jgi:hypothetical protein
VLERSGSSTMSLAGIFGKFELMSAQATLAVVHLKTRPLVSHHRRVTRWYAASRLLPVGAAGCCRCRHKWCSNRWATLQALLWHRSHWTNRSRKARFPTRHRYRWWSATRGRFQHDERRHELHRLGMADGAVDATPARTCPSDHGCGPFREAKPS